MSATKIQLMKPLIKQFLSDSLLETTTTLILKQFELFEAMDIRQTKDYLNEFYQQNSLNILKKLALGLNEFSSPGTLPSDSDVKMKKKELRKFIRSLRRYENIKTETDSFCHEEKINEQSSSTVTEPIPEFNTTEYMSNRTSTAEENETGLLGLQVKPLHKLINNPVSIENGSNTHPVFLNDQETTESASNEFSIIHNEFDHEAGASNFSERKKRKRKKKKKSKKDTHNLGSRNRLDEEATLNPHDSAKNYTNGCDQILTSDSVINSVEQPTVFDIPNIDNVENPACSTEIVTKLLDHVKSSLSEANQTKILQGIYQSIIENCPSAVSIIENCPSTVSSSTSSFHKTKKKKDQENKEPQSDEIVFLDISEDHDTEPVVDIPKHKKKKKRDKRIESENKAENVDVPDELVSESTPSPKKKKKKRHREASGSYGSEFEEGSVQLEIVEESPLEEPLKKKRKKKKSKRHESVEEEEEFIVPEPSVPQVNEVGTGASPNETQRSLAGSCHEGGETTTLRNDASPSKSSHNYDFKPTLYDYEQLLSEYVINRRQTNPAFNNVDKYFFESSRKPSSLNHQSSSVGQPLDVAFSFPSDDKGVGIQFPSYELNSEDSDTESDSSILIIDQLVSRVKTEFVPPDVENNPVVSPEPFKEKSKKSSKNHAPCHTLSDTADSDDSDVLQEIINLPDSSDCNRTDSSELRQPEKPVSNSGISEVMPNPESVVENVLDSSSSSKENMFRSLEKELLELEQCLLLADKAGSPENPKSKSAVSRERKFSSTVSAVLQIKNFFPLSGSNSDGIIDFKCYKCGESFENKYTLMRHWLQHVKDKLMNEKPQEEPKIYECNKCQKKYARKSTLANHIVRHCYKDLYPVEVHKCTLCFATFSYPEDLTRHVWDIHKRNKNFICPLCGRSCSSSSNLHKHMRVHSELRPFKCHLCDATFKTKRTLEFHSATHSDERPFKCDLCEATFKLKHYLNAHRPKHLTVRSFKCRICKASYKDLKTLQHHMVCHSLEKPYKCEIFNAAFKRKQILKHHVLVHSDEKPFSCDLCEYSAKRLSSLKLHRKRSHYS